MAEWPTTDQIRILWRLGCARAIPRPAQNRALRAGSLRPGLHRLEERVFAGQTVDIRWSNSLVKLETATRRLAGEKSARLGSSIGKALLIFCDT